MVLICDTPYNNSDYNEYFTKYDFVLSDFQKYAIQSIVDGDHTLVTAHTGSGKTLPAEFAIKHFTSQGKKVVYTSPIKALSNQKYYEFTQKYPHISFGIFTGDIKINANAQVLIMTTEILKNYFSSHN
jgi:antiviral helicase SKI2